MILVCFSLSVSLFLCTYKRKHVVLRGRFTSGRWIRRDEQASQCGDDHDRRQQIASLCKKKPVDRCNTHYIGVEYAYTQEETREHIRKAMEAAIEPEGQATSEINEDTISQTIDLSKNISFESQPKRRRKKADNDFCGSLH